MSEQQGSPGEIVWHDLTVPNADEVRDFYSAVVGWKVQHLDMGGYADYCMLHEQTGAVVSGVVHAQGVNADLPPVWLMYVKVASLEASMAACKRLGGTVMVGPKSLGEGHYCVIRDPGGAMLALMS